MHRVLLDTGLDNRRVAWLRAPTGGDELSAERGVDALLDRCLVDRGERTVAPGMARRLPLPDRDRLLLALQRMLFGDQVDGDARCSRCGESFSLRFSLASLAGAHVPRRPRGVHGPDTRGLYRLDDITFRLPSSEDLDAIAMLDEDRRAVALLHTIVVSGDVAGREAEVEDAMAALGPTLDVDLAATCPHCASEQRPRFSIAAFLERQLASERRFVLREVHRLARAYGWSYEAILSIPRDDRHDFVALVEGETRRGSAAPVSVGAAP
jgi:hypothetical protein